MEYRIRMGIPFSTRYSSNSLFLFTLLSPLLWETRARRRLYQDVTSFTIKLDNIDNINTFIWALTNNCIGLHRTASNCIELHLTASAYIWLHRTASDFCIGLHRTTSDCIGLHRTSASDCIGLHLTASDCIWLLHRTASDCFGLLHPTYRTSDYARRIMTN